MNQEIQLDTNAEAALADHRALFAPVVGVNPVWFSNPAIGDAFRPGVAKDPALAAVPEPSLDWAFGVACGSVHGEARVCALVFTQFSQLKAFYAKNPALHGTLVTCWHGAAAIWIRATGRLPNNFAADGVRWCLSGLIPVGCPKQPAQTFLSQAGEIKQVAFGGLVWSEEQEDEIATTFLEMEVGPPFRRQAGGRKVLNLEFWARYFTTTMRFSYDPDKDLLTWGDPQVGSPAQLGDAGNLREFTHLLQIAARSFGAEFPQGEIRLDRVRQILARIKLLTTQARISDGEVLAAFMTNQLVRTPGKDVTSREIRAAFVQFNQMVGQVACPETRFYRRLTNQIRNQLGIAQRHDIVRNGKKVRGYGGLSLKSVASVKTADVADVSDGAQNTAPEPVAKHVA